MHSALVGSPRIAVHPGPKVQMMVTVRARIFAVAVLSLTALAGCSREQQDWRSAEGADTVEGYGQFIERHPDSELATQARARVTQLGEDRDWTRAGSADTPDSYRQFLTQHSNGKWAQEAHIRLESFSLGGTPARDPGAATAAPPVAAIPDASVTVAPSAAQASAVPAPRRQEPTARTSTPAVSPAAAPTGTSAGGGGYGIQLGAFSSEDKANGEWRVLLGRFGPQLQGLTSRVVTADTPSGKVFRLQAQAGDESRARTICDSLRRQSQPCVPVLPH